MKQHHKNAIENLTESLKKDDKYLAVIITGSVAKGEERDDSDIDFILVVTDIEYEKRKRRNRLIYYDTQFCDYPGGYVDGKIVNLGFLKTVAERGSEPARDAFRDAWIAFSKIPEIEEILKKIPIYQKDEKAEKIQSFLAQFEISYWYIGEAERRKDKYLLTRAATDLVLFGGRLILAHNEIIYPFHKLFMNALKRAPEKPENLIELINTLIEKPSSKSGQAFYETVKNFKKWRMRGFPNVQYMIDTELAWIEGKPYIGDI
jgi:predicted nucleotidyltransferase